MSRATRKVPKLRRRAQPRSDGWENPITSLGVLGRDKRRGTNFNPDVVVQENAEQVWQGDDIAARIVETPPEDMLREGYEICLHDDPEYAEEIEENCERLALNEHMRTAMEYQRAYGGGAILLGVNDGLPLSAPLDPARVRSVDWLTTYTPRELTPWTYYADQSRGRYGDIALYHLTPTFIPPGSKLPPVMEVHESRLIKFQGVVTSRISLLRSPIPGWGRSVFDRIMQVISDFQANWAGASILMQDFAPGVLKLKQLAKIIATQSKDDVTIQNRAQAIALGRSIANTTILDAEEEFERKTVSVSGLAELLAAFNLRLGAAAEMPVAMIMGDSPAGLNATGDSDHRWYYNRIKARQKSKVEPKLKSFIRLLAGRDASRLSGLKIKFNPLWMLTEAEQATMRKTQAETDQIYITTQVATPQEIAQSRFTRRGYSTSTTIDLDLRDEMANADDEKARLGEGAAADKETERKTAEQAAKPQPPAKP